MSAIREGTRIIYTLKDGETYCFYKHLLVIAHPERPPFTIDMFTGEQKELDPNAQLSEPPKQ